MKRSIIILCAVMIVSVAWMPEARADKFGATSNSAAATFCLTGGINPLVFQRAEEHIVAKYGYDKGHSHWEASREGFSKAFDSSGKLSGSRTHYMILYWDGNFKITRPEFAEVKIIETGQWTQWLKP